MTLIKSLPHPSYRTIYKFNEEINAPLKDLCETFLKKMNMNFFCHTIHFNDGTQFNIMTDLNFFRYGLENNLLSAKSPSFCDRVRMVPPNESRLSLWTGIPQDGDRLYKSLYEFDIWNGITIIFREIDRIHCWSFGTNKENQRVLSDYINNVDVLKEFIVFFKNNSRHLFSLDDKRTFLNSGFNLPSYDERAQNKFSKIKAELVSNRRAQGDTQKYLTAREIELLNYLSQGKSMKESAHLMNLSYRTLEDYIKNAKRRTECYNKSQLINYFIKEYKEPYQFFISHE